jgi:uncharacterized protein YecE (DUF72 family)
MVVAPTGTEDIAAEVRTAAEVNLSTRSLLRARLLHLDGVVVVELEDERTAVTVSADGDPHTAAEQLEEAAGTLLAAAHELRSAPHYRVDWPLGPEQDIPMCACGQPWGHPNAAFS